MYQKLLEESGLTKNEAIVYTALLKLGNSKAGEIIHDAKISSGKIYETLDKLSAKGLVKTVIENGVKHFIANDPGALLLYLDEKERTLHEKKKDLEKIIPDLEQLRKLDAKLDTVSIIKGFRGVSPIIYDALEKNAKKENNLEKDSDIMVMGVRSSKNVKFNNFWKKWHRKRIELKKNALMLFCDKETDYWKFFKKLPYTKVRETLSFSPSAVMIIDDAVFIFSYDEELICIHIVSKSIADSFLGFFNSMWKFSE
jgi:DNA-binding PadR family transcriptional regulator